MKQIVILIIVMSLSGCGDGRPELEEVGLQFEKLYPNVELVDIQIMEDEVVARSFRFHYRDKVSNQEGEIEIQFMETEDEKGWKPQPAAPKSLLLKEAEQGGETDS